MTLRRTDLYASPDDSQAPADFFWGGVVLSGFSRWDAAGGWLAVAYAGQTLFAKASDVSLNDAPGRDAPYVGRTLGRVSMYPAPDLSSEPFDLLLGRRGGPRRPVGRRRGVGALVLPGPGRVPARGFGGASASLLPPGRHHDVP